MVCDPAINEGAVGENTDQETTLLRCGVDVQEVGPGEDLTTRVQQPQAPGLLELVEQRDVLVERQLPIAGAGI